MEQHSPVVISYPTLLTSPDRLLPEIDKAFGSDPNSLGIIILSDLPEEYAIHRNNLLRLAYKFAQLDHSVRESYSDPSSTYSFGWSHGKEIMNGRPDTLKGSFYANPLVEEATVSHEERRQFPEYYGKNIWPKKDERGVEGFQEAFKNLSEFIFKVGCELARACQPFASSYLIDATLSLSELIAKSQTTKARLLYYFPPSEDSLADAEAIDNWCGFHLDHSLLTGLCPAMFFRHTESEEPEVVAPPSATSGLYIRTRGGNLSKVSIPSNCLAFQTGEALEIATNGRLLATPHCVRVGSLSARHDVISRASFALFMQPNTDVNLSERITFGQFSKQVFEKHYEAIG